MPRGFQVDHQATLLRFGGRRWWPGDSFVSKPKFIEGDGEEAHLLLYGKADKGAIRAEIFRRNREANAGVNKCVECGMQVYEFITTTELERRRGDWDHIRNKPGERCDCPENGQVLCVDCHRKKHVRVLSGKKEKVGA